MKTEELRTANPQEAGEFSDLLDQVAEEDDALMMGHHETGIPAHLWGADN